MPQTDIERPVEAPSKEPASVENHSEPPVVDIGDEGPLLDSAALPDFLSQVEAHPLSGAEDFDLPSLELDLPARGSLSERYEVGNRGAETISEGVGDYGGISYGQYQLPSNVEGQLSENSNVMNFIRQSPFADNFEGLKLNSAEFKAKWVELATDEKTAESFAETQHAYVQHQNYDPLVAAFSAESGIDVNYRSRALQNVVWSTAVQHGGETNVLTRALAATGKTRENLADEELIRAIYEERGRVYETDTEIDEKSYPAGTLVRFRSSGAEVQQGVENRFENELSDALEQLEEERDLREEIEDAEPDAVVPEPLLLPGLDGEAMRRYFEEADRLRAEPSETQSDGRAQIEKVPSEINESQGSIFHQAEPTFDPRDPDYLGLPKPDAAPVPADADVRLLWTDLSQPDIAREAEEAAQGAEEQTNTVLLLSTQPVDETSRSEPPEPDQQWMPDTSEVVNEHPIPTDDEEADQPKEPDLVPQAFEPTPPNNRAEAPQSVTVPESVKKSEPEPVAAAEPPPTAAEAGEVVMPDTPAAVESARVDLSPPPTSEKTFETHPAESNLPDVSQQQVPAVEDASGLDSAGNLLAGAAVSLLPGRVEKPRMVENVTPYSHEDPQFEVQQTDKDVAVEKVPPPPEQVQAIVENTEQTENAESAEGADGADGGTGGEGGDGGGDGGE